MKTAVLFAGQGAQKLGMARDLYQKYDVVKDTFHEASQILGYDLRALIDEKEDLLNQTRYTQPAILTTSVAIYRVLQENGIEGDMTAGLSLGEYSALVASGALDFLTAVDLVAKRGKFMEEATSNGKMVAVLNTDAKLIEDICRNVSQKGIVSPANYNTPDQIVIGGEVEAVNAAVEQLKAAGVKRLIPLKVSGPFHTALLNTASQKLALELDGVIFKQFKKPLVSNTTAEVMPYEEIKNLLIRQVKEPVRFYASLATLQGMGATNFIEIGPGKILSGFVKKINPKADIVQVEDVDSIQYILEER